VIGTEGSGPAAGTHFGLDVESPSPRDVPARGSSTMPEARECAWRPNGNGAAIRDRAPRPDGSEQSEPYVYILKEIRCAIESETRGAAS
jgi:hypothetical protein